LIALVNARPGDLIVFALIVPIPLILYAAFKHAMGRIEDQFTHLEHVNRMHLATVEALATAIEAKDGVTHDHIRRVQQYAVRLAQAIGVNDVATIKAIEAAALLHDTGKLAVPEHILNKPGKLTPAEFEKMKRHVDVGADILSGIEFPFPVVPIVRCHHEAWDGSGYPRGVRGTDIPIGARVLSVVDCFDALTSDRPYRRALSDEAAINILMARRGTMYDPDVVDAFVQMCREREARSVPEPEVARPTAQINETAAREPSATVATVIDRDDQEETATSSAASANPDREALRDLSLLVTAVLRCDLPGATCAFYLATDEDTLVVCHAVGRLAPALRGFTIAVNTGLSGWVAAHRETIINSDAQLDLDLLGLTPTRRMCMSTPLLDGGTLVGVLTVYTESPLPITEDHGRTLQAMAPHVARIVSRSRGAEVMMPTPAMVRCAEPDRILVAM
jgi:putative nucleotidyltransferase with HDIG domain